MRIFEGTLIEKMRKKKDISPSELLREIVKVADSYKHKRTKIKASKQYLDRILNGKAGVLGSLYMGMLADLLECKTDDFFLEVESHD